MGRISRGTVGIAQERDDGAWNRKMVVEVESKGDRDLQEINLAVLDDGLHI